jgi:hypothetical protein
VSTKNAVEEYVKSRGGSRVIKKVSTRLHGWIERVMAPGHLICLDLGDDVMHRC